MYTTSLVVSTLLILGLFGSSVLAHDHDNDDAPLSFYYGPASPTNCVTYANWKFQPQPTGTWSFEALVNERDCDFHAATAGVRGWNAPGGAAVALQTPLNGTLAGLRERVRQAFRNMKQIVGAWGATLQDVTSIVVMTYDIVIVRPLVNGVQSEAEFWGPQANWTVPAYPARTIIGSIQFNGLDCVSAADHTVYGGTRGASGQAVCLNSADYPVGDILEIDFTFAYPKSGKIQYPYSRDRDDD
jgi:enamine deaminase RidA (YjgF/YER057c/UK114 family)